MYLYQNTLYLLIQLRYIIIRQLNMQLWAQHYRREGYRPHRGRNRIDHVHEWRGCPLGNQLDDVDRAKDHADHHDHHPGDFLADAECWFEYVSENMQIASLFLFDMGMSALASRKNCIAYIPLAPSPE